MVRAAAERASARRKVPLQIIHRPAYQSGNQSSNPAASPRPFQPYLTLPYLTLPAYLAAIKTLSTHNPHNATCHLLNLNHSLTLRTQSHPSVHPSIDLCSVRTCVEFTSHPLPFTPPYFASPTTRSLFRFSSFRSSSPPRPPARSGLSDSHDLIDVSALILRHVLLLCTATHITHDT